MTHEEFEGIAALDAIGASTPEEAERLRAHLETCGDCRQATAEFSDAAALLAQGLDPVAPPADLREAVIGAVDHIDEIAAHRRGTKWWLATAATLFLALWVWREFSIRVIREKVTAQQVEIQHLIDEKKMLVEQKEKIAEDLAALTSSETRMISLAGQSAAPTAFARMFLRPRDGRAVVFFYNLPPCPPELVYQMWVVRKDQPKPQSAGVFEATDGSASMSVGNLPDPAQIKAFAVTMEPRGGVEQPTSAKYYVMGTT